LSSSDADLNESGNQFGDDGWIGAPGRLHHLSVAQRKAVGRIILAVDRGGQEIGPIFERCPRPNQAAEYRAAHVAVCLHEIPVADQLHRGGRGFRKCG